MPQHLVEVLEYLKVHHEASPRQLKEALSPNSHAMSIMNNRLSELEELGYVKRLRKEGRTYIWGLSNEPYLDEVS